MKNIKIIVSLVALMVIPVLSYSDINADRTEQKVGVVYRDKGGILFLAIPDSGIELGTKVIIYTAPGRQVICCAEASGAGTLKPEGDRFALFNGETVTVYPLLPEKERKTGIDIGFGIIGPPDLYSAKDNTIRLDLNEDGTSDSFRDCTSYEGVHLTIWAGKPLESERLWHAYFYLAYETEPSCEEKDYKD